MRPRRLRRLLRDVLDRHVQRRGSLHVHAVLRRKELRRRRLRRLVRHLHRGDVQLLLLLRRGPVREHDLRLARGLLSLQRAADLLRAPTRRKVFGFGRRLQLTYEIAAQTGQTTIS
jgi:hypothetical protein